MSFNIGLSGLAAANNDLNVISNNIANANTTGFKGSRAEFGDLFQSAAYNLASSTSGDGVETQTVAQQFSQGTIVTSSNPLDLAISGSGFFTLSNSGATEYTRNGTFSTDSSGYVVNASGARLQVYPPIASGNAFSTGTLTSLQISPAPNPPVATTHINSTLALPVGGKVPTSATFSPTDTNSYTATTSVSVYDSLGAAHTANLYFVQTATPGTWTMYTTIDGSTVGSAQTLAFDGNGKLTTPASGTVTLPTFTPSTGASAMNLTLDLGNTVQYGSSFAVSSLTQDGYTTGQLSGVSVSNTGVITAQYTNGQTVALGQVAMANFANPQGLAQLGNETWAQTFASGTAIPGSAGSSNFGSIQSGALESSNVDLTQQLVNMMNAQRDYQANAQVISTNDQMLQTILQLR